MSVTGVKTRGETEVLTGALPSWFPFHTLIAESQVDTPTFNRDYFRVDNRIGVSCVQWCEEQKPEGTPAHWDSYSFAGTFYRQQRRRSSGVILLKLAPTGSGQAEGCSTETKRAVGPGLEE